MKNYKQYITIKGPYFKNPKINEQNIKVKPEIEVVLLPITCL